MRNNTKYLFQETDSAQCLCLSLYILNSTACPYFSSLRKHAYSNVPKFFPPKNENFQIKILIFFNISAQNIDCGEAVLTSTHNLYFEQK